MSTQPTSSQGLTRVIEFITENKPTDTTILRSEGWLSSDGCVRLSCNCGTKFRWPSDLQEHRQNRWIPDRRFLNFCSGCGKPITGVEIPNTP